MKKTAAEVKQKICLALNKDAVSHSTSKKWFQRLRSQNLDLEDERLSQPQKVKDKELEELLKKNPCRAQSELAETRGVTRRTISKREI